MYEAMRSPCANAMVLYHVPPHVEAYFLFRFSRVDIGRLFVSCVVDNSTIHAHLEAIYHASEHEKRAKVSKFHDG